MVDFPVFLDGDTIEFIVGVLLALLLEYGSYSQVESIQSFFVEVKEQFFGFKFVFLVE